MQPKRFLATLLAVILICLAAGTTVSAAEASPLKLGVSVSAEDAVSTEPVTVQAGDTLEVSVTVAETKGVSLLEFYLAYDPAVVSVKTVGDKVSAEIGSFFSSLKSSLITVVEPGVIRAIFYATSDAKDAGTIVTFSFDVIGCAAETKGATAIELVDRSTTAAFNTALDELEISYVNDGKASFAAHDKLEEAAVEDSPCVTAALKCPACESIVVETVANHELETFEEVPATCYSVGTTAGARCKKCDHKVGLEEIPMIPHDIRHVAAKEVGCLEDGWNAYDECQREGCDYSTKEVIKAKGEHTIVIDPAVEPTTSSEGKTEGSHCSVCGEIIKKQETIPMKASLLWLWILIAVVLVVAAGVVTYFFVFKKPAKTKHIGRPGSQK